MGRRKKEENEKLEVGKPSVVCGHTDQMRKEGAMQERALQCCFSFFRLDWPLASELSLPISTHGGKQGTMLPSTTLKTTIA